MHSCNGCARAFCILLLLVVGLLCACGGSSSPPWLQPSATGSPSASASPSASPLSLLSPTASASPSSSPTESSSPYSSSSPYPSPSLSSTPTPKEEFSAYLQQAKVVRARYMSVRDQMDRISRKQAHRYADSTWPPAGRKIAKLAKRLYAVETNWALITPPRDLLAAHKAYGKSISFNRKWYELEAYCYINELDMSDTSTHGKQLRALVNKADDAFDVYRLAVTVKAKRLHVKIPWKFSL